MKTFGAHLQEQIKETSYRFVYLWFDDPDDPDDPAVPEEPEVPEDPSPKVNAAHPA